MNGSSVECRTNGTGACPLHIAAMNGNAEVVKVLLEYNADIDSRQSNGSTALLLATYNKHHEVVRVLLESGADPEEKGSGGRKPVHIAAIFGDINLIKKFLLYGVEINSQVI